MLILIATFQSFDDEPILQPIKKKVDSDPLLLDFINRPTWPKLSYLVKVLQKEQLGYLMCECCGIKEGELHPETGTTCSFQTDHIDPVSKYPEKNLDIHDKQILCSACNQAKSNIDRTDWR